MAPQTTKVYAETWKEMVHSLLEVQRNVRQNLLRGEPLEKVLENLVLSIQGFNPEMVGSVLLLDKESGLLRNTFAPDLPAAFVKLLHKVPAGHLAGPDRGRRFVVENITEEPQWESISQLALEHNLMACWSEPLVSAVTGKLLGSFTLYCPSSRKPTEEEVMLLEVAGDIASAAIEWEQVLNERKALVSKLKSKNKELEERVNARTQELEHQNHINRLFTENSTVGMFMTNENGYCTYVNAAAQQMTGYTLEELKAKPLHDIIHHSHPDGTPFPMNECLIDNAIHLDIELRAHEDVFIRKDGTFFPVTCAASPIIEQGTPIGTIVEVRDTTEEKLYEEEIRDSTERLRLILEAMPQISWTAGKSGELDYINGTWLEYTGLPKEEAIGNAWIGSVHPDDRLRVIERWQESLVKGIDYETDFRIRGYDGSYRWFLVRAVPLVSQDGEILKWFGTCTDTHEQLIAIKKLAKAQEQLKAINLELSAANKELTVTNADLDNFIYTASHDLRSPIVNLESLLTALREELGQKPDIVEKLLDMMSGSIARFQKTIADLTEISRTQKNLDDSSEMVNLPELLEEVKQSIGRDIKEAGATVEADLGGIEFICFSRKNLRSILYNLISNSIKYRSPERDALVKVTVKQEKKDLLLLKVEDNGLGFKMENADQVFTMFKRLHDHVEGSGVGLYIVKRIVENAGGKIEVTGESGKGASFSIYLPNKQPVTVPDGEEKELK